VTLTAERPVVGKETVDRTFRSRSEQGDQSLEAPLHSLRQRIAALDGLVVFVAAPRNLEKGQERADVRSQLPDAAQRLSIPAILH
jgi:hypothetical protein